MKLSDWLTRLAKGPIGTLPQGGDASGTIPDAHVPGIVDKLQQALTALYTRFPLTSKTIQLAVVSGRYEYPLQTRFAQTSGSTEIDKFIVDTMGQPFLGDVVAIERVFDGDKCPLGLNDRADACSWFTTAYDTLSMDYPVTGDLYFVQFRANHATLDPASLELNNQEVRVPPALEGALAARVAYEVFCGLTSENAVFKAQELMAKYEQACAEVEQRNTVNSSEIDVRTQQFCRQGWV